MFAGSLATHRIWANNQPTYMNNPNVSDAFKADGQYMTLFNISTKTYMSNWAAQKGSNNIILGVGTGTSFGYGYGSTNVNGGGTGDGYMLFSLYDTEIDGYARCDALATAISGTSKPFTIIMSCMQPVAQPSLAQPTTRLYTFGSTSTATPLIDALYSGSNANFIHNRRNNSNTLFTSSQLVPGFTPAIITYHYDGSTCTTKVNGTIVDNAIAFGSGALTVNVFTIGAYLSTGGIVSEWSYPYIRALVFSTSNSLTASQIHDIEIDLARDARIAFA